MLRVWSMRGFYPLLQTKLSREALYTVTFLHDGMSVAVGGADVDVVGVWVASVVVVETSSGAVASDPPHDAARTPMITNADSRIAEDGNALRPAARCASDGTQ